MGGNISTDLLLLTNTLHQQIKSLKTIITHQQNDLTAHKELTDTLVSRLAHQIDVFGRNKIGYNFVFLFANPSYVGVGGKEKIKFESVAHQKQFQTIRLSLERAQIEITVHKVHATPFNFRNSFEQ